MCETCRARRYCTAKCLHADDKINLHMSDCTLLKLGLEGIVAERRGWHVNDWGEKREREGKDPNPRTRFFGAYDKDPNYWNH